MKNIVKYGYIICSLIFLIYLVLPNPEFPEKIDGSYQSGEPADIEDIDRRGYYTNINRSQVLNYYLQGFNYPLIINNNILEYRLNYPPEEAQIIIRDQTRSTYLEEIVHPFRESIYINGFEPKLDKDRIIINGIEWNQKIIVKYIKSMAYQRLIIGLITLILFYLIMIETTKICRSLWISIKSQ